MVSSPIFLRLRVSGYGKPFPGLKEQPGLDIAFKPGMTLVLGTKWGLGKTTLIHILYRLLTGPFDIPGLAGRGDLGNVRLNPTQLPHTQRRLFAQRVTDGARNARAVLDFTMGDRFADPSQDRQLYTLIALPQSGQLEMG